MKFYPLSVEDLDGEQWRPIDGYEGYQISNLGRVKSFARGKAKILKLFSVNGYLRVNLSKDGKEEQLSIHRLVAKAFVPNPLNKPEVNHLNGIKTDNRVQTCRKIRCQSVGNQWGSMWSKI